MSAAQRERKKGKEGALGDTRESDEDRKCLRQVGGGERPSCQRGSRLGRDVKNGLWNEGGGRGWQGERNPDSRNGEGT